MPSLANPQSNEFTKHLVEGDSGTGKTGSLASLVSAGYSLRILDFDNGLDVLKAYITKDDPALLANVEFRTLLDKRKATSLLPFIVGSPKAVIESIKLLYLLKYIESDGSVIDLSVPAEW